MPAVLVESAAVTCCPDASAHSVPVMVGNFDFHVERIHSSHTVWSGMIWRRENRLRSSFMVCRDCLPLDSVADILRLNNKILFLCTGSEFAGCLESLNKVCELCLSKALHRSQGFTNFAVHNFMTV